MAETKERVSSLDESCNESKFEYENCFNDWFKFYLNNFNNNDNNNKIDLNENLNGKCGKFFNKYNKCLMVSVLYMLILIGCRCPNELSSLLIIF